MSSRWVLPLGSAEREDWAVVVDETVDGWQYTGLYAGALLPGEQRGLSTGARELMVVPLSGSVDVRCTDSSGATSEVRLVGRSSVFAGPADVAFVPRDSDLVLQSAETTEPCRVALAVAVVPDQPIGPVPGFQHLAAADVPVELRGAGQASREVRNFGVPGVLDAEALIACEVITPAGNWSSYPPHKHDTRRDGVESQLEEIYYHEVQASADAPEGADPMAYLRVYGTADREIDVLAEVRTGDVVLVPHGWHGPAMAVPGYDLYYLNVMAGPGPERAWLICDDPAHGWVRDTWTSQAVDPRLPLGSAR
ncbi:MAG TPA: 5-deoxy-glucuronate isomerase [Lapillicoccus sp.]|jgi:5-deoxy-glucuronate isomerase|uniref:5-deoxy-glucuronate isomerase n=1 Tax=Lapillicoccus sp. TaxID=1909287 RepID=UPI002F946F77